MTNTKILDGIEIKPRDRVRIKLFSNTNPNYWVNSIEALGTVEGDFDVKLDQPYEDMTRAHYFSEADRRYIVLENLSDPKPEPEPEPEGFVVTINVDTLKELKSVLSPISDAILAKTTVVSK